MTVKQLVEKLELKVLAGADGLDRKVQGCYICDLLSWVMSRGDKDNVWITVQTNINIIAVALMTEISCIIIPEDIEVDSQTIGKAQQENIPLLSSNLSSFQLVKKMQEDIE